MNGKVVNYKFEILSENSEIAVIELFQSALGGVDAINFTDAVNNSSENNIKLLIIDLNKVEIMNSSGLGMLVNALSNLKKHNIQLNLVSVPAKVLKLLQITQLDKVFKIFENSQIAISNYK